jgi:hypothetical protein
MKKQVILLILSIVIIHNTSADMMTELAKRDRKNPIRIIENDRYGLYAKDGYLHTEYWEDGFGVPSIVAYQIHEDAIKLIVRIKTWDFAFRIYDLYYERDGIDRFTVEVHNYYLVELLYINDKLETYCNRIRDINTNGFIFNEAEIGGNINKVPDYYPTYPYLETDLTEGMKVKIAAMTNERTNELAVNSHAFETYDYYYHILVDDQQVKINGYLLDFSNKVDYRAPLLILESGNTPQAAPPEDDFKGVSGYLITGTMIKKTGDYPDTNSITEYIYIRPDNKNLMLWYNFYVPN